MLLDDVMQFPAKEWGAALGPFHAQRVKRFAPQARAFVFDEKASRTVGQFIRTCPDLIAEQIEFALAPYDVTYIEIDLDAVMLGMGRAGDGGDDPDWKLGFLIADRTILTLVNSHRRQTASASAFGTINIAATAEAAALSDEEHSRSAEILLGSTFHDLDAEHRRMFTERFGVGYFGPPGLERELGRALFGTFNGEARIVVACLLMLYQRKHISLHESPAHRGMKRGKSRAFMSHSTVTINLSDEPDFRRCWHTAHRGPVRRHEVRTHYAHRRIERGCIHEWQRDDEAAHNEQWTCQRCGGLRFLKRHYLRGDARIGFVQKTYRITN